VRNIRITVEYEGTLYAGWQIQPGERTIQGALTEAIRRVTGQETSVIGAGRTDAGVHALGQVAGFRIDHPLEAERFSDAINYYLPADIRVKHSCEVPLSFHATRDARFRRYRYLVAEESSAVYRRLRWECRRVLDPAILQEAALLVRGEHDFAPFCKTSSLLEDNACRIERSRWRQVGPLFVYEIRGNRFLHGMVRSLVGAMVNLAGEPKDRNSLNLTLARFSDILDARTDDRVPFTAPARGLYLVSVGY
jgi:tRNA pseudouridine38-40 synthase